MFLKRPETHMSDIEQRTLALGTNVALAAAGGYLDAFTYIGHGHVFANAMTGNVVLLAVNAAMGNWHQSLQHLPPIVTFCFGVAFARAIGSSHRPVIVLALEISAFFVLSWLPTSASNFLIVTVICFVASLQTATFRQINKAAYNSTFTTGNLRTLSETFFDWAFKDRGPESRKQTIDFFAICTAFVLGALVGGLLTPRLRNKALLLVTVLLLAVLVHLMRFTDAAHRRPASSG
jgi:uncharacterized membrane protein YoaK (UPF0700 family)